MISGVQTLEFGKWIAVEIADKGVKNEILTKGLVIKNCTRDFQQHERRDTIKVFVNQLPLGITQDEVRASFTKYGHIHKLWPGKKSYHGKPISNGDWCSLFDVLKESIPSYVNVRGWNAYVTYRGQAKTCRICHNRDHFARDCPTKNNNQDQPENMDVPEQASQNVPDPENPGETAPNDRVLEKVTIEDCQIQTSVEPDLQQDAQELETQSQAWADSPEGNPINVGSEKPQDNSSSEPATPRSIQKQIFGTDTEISDDEPSTVLSIWGDEITDCSSKPDVKKPVVYCSQCRENSRPDEGCTASIIEEANKKALSTGARKKGKKGKVTYKRFMNGLDHVVMRGKRTDDVQHILELSDSNSVYALYLLHTYGDYVRAKRDEVRMSGNREVMDHWR